VFPYLNAVLPDTSYNPGAGSITLRKEGRLLTFYGRGAVLAKVDGAEDALAQLAWFCNLCNEVWARREEIVPSYACRPVVGLLDLYSLLPRTNCGECGERTCIAFAVGLLLRTRRPGECPPLGTEESQPSRNRLCELLGIGTWA
jgi:ArsR family metal-binding transcriptional regulator